MTAYIRRRRSSTDHGMTLPEVLISMLLMGTLMTALVAATTVILRQQDNSSGRLNNNRSETNVGLWMPSDLASAEEVHPEPEWVPCGDVAGNECPPGINIGGSNALMLVWTGSIAGSTEAITTVTKVSYRYVEIDGEFVLLRVACTRVASAPPTCDQVIVLHDLVPPPMGQNWDPGHTSPTWVIKVNAALDPSVIDLGGDVPTTVRNDPTLKTKNGQRVSVTINGGGDVAGAGGGQDQITLSAGGTERHPVLGTTTFSDPPSFGATRSRCGGNFAMLVDTSGSIDWPNGTNQAQVHNMASVISGIRAFIDAFAGTPIKLEVVRFSSTSSTLGANDANGEWSRYFDMLVESDVTDLKSLVGTLASSGSTNWEDGLFRVFKNRDGTVQSTLPDTLIFFTDGLPNDSRLDGSSSPAPAVANIDDQGLGTGSSYNQEAWNRADRLAREYDIDVKHFIGVYVGTDTTGQSSWKTQGPGYHYENYEKGYHLTYARAYHTDYLKGYHLFWEQGYHLANFQKGYHQTWDQGYHLTNFQRGYHISYQYAATGMTFQRKQSGNWNTTSWSTYSANNSDNTSNDNYRTQIANVNNLGTWTDTTQTIYNKSNIGADSTDGFRTVVTYSSPYSAFEATTEALYNTNNTTADNTDGWTATNAYSSPYTLWQSVTQSAYNAGNTTADATDGYRVNNVYTTPFSLWENTTEALYNTNNTTADNTDGWTASNAYSSPYTLWQTATQAVYNAGNTTADSSDGYRVSNVYSTPFTNWEITTQALYNANNTKSDNTDGWFTQKTYAAPFSTWEATDAASYNANNTTADDLDGWQATRVYSSTYDAWEASTKEAYDIAYAAAASNRKPALDGARGWRASKVYAQPFTQHDNATSTNVDNTWILSKIVAGGATPVPAVPSGGPYTNADVADLYVLPNWNQFAGALNSMALAECGGTVTVQTRIDGRAAADPFTYFNSADRTQATTSSQFRSGTFDFDLAGGVSTATTISTMDVSGLTKFAPVRWDCKSSGVPIYPVEAAIDGSPWHSITLTVAPNQVISCIQTVRLK